MDNVLIFGRFLNLIFNMFVKNSRDWRALSFALFSLVEKGTRSASILFCTIVLFASCRNHRERLIEDFSGHNFEQLDLVQTLENFDEYSEDSYFASQYDISPADADALEKILALEAPGTSFARSQMAPFLQPASVYRYSMHSGSGETSVLLLDKDHMRIIFYHSRTGR